MWIEEEMAVQVLRQTKSGFLSFKYSLSPPANPTWEGDEVTMLNDTYESLSQEHIAYLRQMGCWEIIETKKTEISNR